MAKRRVNIKGYLIFLIIVGAGVYSYFHSQEVYSYYMRIYYEKILGITVEQQVSKAEQLYAGREYEKLKNNLKELLMVYPENRDLRRLQGLTFIKLGERSKGAETILAASDDAPIPEKMLEETARSLYEQGQYRDIVRVLEKRGPGTNPNLLFYYGVALYETGSYARAADNLKKAISEGRTDYEAYHYEGMALYKKGETRAALPFLEHARNMNAEDHEVARSLANTYRKLGRYDDAARILRKIKE
jgi:tetratricopeptide (TPR) repeat protein